MQVLTVLALSCGSIDEKGFLCSPLGSSMTSVGSLMRYSPHVDCMDFIVNYVDI